MLKALPIGLVAISLVLSTAAFAQQDAVATDGVRSERGHGERGMRMSPDDRAAFLDARVAALHAGLRLNPEQDKNWPPVEAAIRDLAKERAQMAAQRRERMEQRDPPDPIQRLRTASETMSARAAGLKRLADASEPLYRSLDDGQKRRLEILGRRVMQPHGLGRRR